MNRPSTSATGRVAVYVTSHGFGHLNRSVAVINRIPPGVAVSIRSDADLFPAWRERLARPAELVAYTSDAGALNPPGDSAATDGPGTLRRAAEVHAAAMAGADEEVARLHAEGAGVVLADAPPVPLVAARRAGIPGLLLANFTWAEIYAEHAEGVATAEARRTVDAVRDAYRRASLVLRAEPALPLAGIAPIREVGLVVTPGLDRRAELRAGLGLAADARVVYFYFGRYGQDDLDWGRLARFDGVHFVGFHEPPGGAPGNVHVVAADRWTGADLAASSDAMIAKAGYGTVAEAMVARTPLIYPPRAGFAEHRALDEALQAWGGGHRIANDDLRAFRLDRPLAEALARRPGPSPYPTDGADRVVATLLEVLADPARFLRP